MEMNRKNMYGEGKSLVNEDEEEDDTLSLFIYSLLLCTLSP